MVVSAITSMLAATHYKFDCTGKVSCLAEPVLIWVSVDLQQTSNQTIKFAYDAIGINRTSYPWQKQQGR
jgi:hypothetical protein